MSQFPPSTPSGLEMRPHRGVMILVFGILAWVLGCFIFGIVSWVMGNADLQAMRAGTMDREGEGLTQAGRIIGMINVLLTLASLVIGVVVLIIMIAIGAFAAGASGP